ncbi:MAG: C25 family cysteine peptidase [Thermoplasmatota archaeon]
MILRSIVSNESGGELIDIDSVLDMTSTRADTSYDHVIIDGSSRMMGLVATPAACWYDIGSMESFVLPLLVEGDRGIERFTDYTDRSYPMMITDFDLSGNDDTSRSINAATDLFDRSAGVLMISDDEQGYQLGLISAPLSSYLNIPIIITGDGDHDEIGAALGDLGAKYVIAAGHEAVETARSTGIDRIEIDSYESALRTVSRAVQDRFGILNYITLTNPGDTIGPAIIEDIAGAEVQDVNSVLLDTSTADVDLVGSSVYTHSIEVPEGVVDLRLYINFTEIRGYPLDPLKDSVGIEPMSFGTLTDPSGRLVASSPSFSATGNDNYLETLIIDNPGTYNLEVKVYYGVKGLSSMMGTSLGISRISGSYSLDIHNLILERPHLPLFEDLSILAPYLSSSRGGLVIADYDLELTSDDYLELASGFGTGPWYERNLLKVGRDKVDRNVRFLEDSIGVISEFGLEESYMNQKGWLALLGGGNMIPMYYQEKDPSWEEDPVWGTGWATDLPYSLNLSLSVGRPLGRSLSDVSALIARTLFYEEYTEGYISDLTSEFGTSGSWKDHFHFLAGEGGGRTGWLFHQREFSATVEQHGFTSEVYMQDYENDRQTMVARGAFVRANFFEMILHGDWSWFSPELNGFDRYSTGVKVSDIMNDPTEWEMGPSVFNSGVCLLGRLGGLRPFQSITQAFFHGGINAFFCATRSTGSEAKAGPIEEALLFEDLSVGEAIRKDKRDNPEVPTYFVRTLYGDPAFNPYEPENGYGDQGLAVLVDR